MRLPYWVLRWMHRQRLSRSRLRGTFLHNWLGDRILDKGLWSPTPGSLARAWLVGWPITVIPFLPGQSIFATVAALFVRGNLLLAIALQFLSTPATAWFHLPACYFVGEVVRGADPRAVWHKAWDAPGDLLTGHAAVSLYLGAVVVGIIGGAMGYALILALWKGKKGRRDTEPPVSGAREHREPRERREHRGSHHRRTDDTNPGQLKLPLKPGGKKSSPH